MLAQFGARDNACSKAYSSVAEQARCGGQAALDEFVARANIKHLTDLLLSEKDETKRARLFALLKDEEAKLAAAQARKAGQAPKDRES